MNIKSFLFYFFLTNLINTCGSILKVKHKTTIRTNKKTTIFVEASDNNKSIDLNGFAPEGVFSQHFYSLGDLLNIPSFGVYNWNKSGVQLEINARIYLQNSSSSSVLGWYFSKYSDYDNSKFLADNHRYPNITHLRRAVKSYGDELHQNHIQNMTNQSNNLRILFKHIHEVIKSTTLLVHMRTGDKGVFHKDFMLSVCKVAKENLFTHVVVMSGVHADVRFSLLNNSLKTTGESMQWILGNISKLGIHASVHYGDKFSHDNKMNSLMSF